MTDILAERFAALADTTDDGDWLDVRRRARPRRRWLAAGAAAAAAVAATAALAASGSWVFSHAGSKVTAVTHVSFHGATWTVAVTTGKAQWFCIRLTPGGGAAATKGCGMSLLPLPAVIQRLEVATRTTPGFPFGGLRYGDGAGELWFGTARADVTRIAITDDRGQVHSAQTVGAPASLRTATRFWAIPLPSSHARSIGGYLANGKLVKRTPVSGTMGKLRTR